MDKKLKTKQKDKMQPKMGKADIDYQVLHDAFFKFQTKPKLSTHGDLYYEGKEFECTLRQKKPGHLSDELKAALGMPEGSPPPWLINMQRYGPPPSYPALKIQGLNAPIPEGASFGYHPGGWGKPPVDQFGRPLYGDVFGVGARDDNTINDIIEKEPWGELEAEDSSSDEEEEDEEEQELDPVTESSGIESVTSITSGLETPDAQLDLRKHSGKATPVSDGKDTPQEEKPLYQVLEQNKHLAVTKVVFWAHRTNMSCHPATNRLQRTLNE